MTRPGLLELPDTPEPKSGSATGPSGKRKAGQRRGRRFHVFGASEWTQTELASGKSTMQAGFFMDEKTKLPLGRNQLQSSLNSLFKAKS